MSGNGCSLIKRVFGYKGLCTVTLQSALMERHMARAAAAAAVFVCVWVEFFSQSVFICIILFYFKHAPHALPLVLIINTINTINKIK